MSDDDNARAWREYDAQIPSRKGWEPAIVESYPPGNGEGANAKQLLDKGLIYLINAAVLFDTGHAVAVDIADANNIIIGSFPPGRTYDELGHEQGLGRMDTETINVVLNQIRAFETRLAKEYEERLRTGDDKTREQIEHGVLTALMAGPRTIDQLVDDIGLTRARISSAIMRLDEKVKRQDDGTYTLSESDET